MGIDLYCENEQGRSLDHVDDTRNLFAHLLDKISREETLCIRFIDRYGDTTFNQMQIPFLIDELQQSISLALDSDTHEQLMKMIDLARNSLGKPHTYLKFRGD